MGAITPPTPDTTATTTKRRTANVDTTMHYDGSPTTTSTISHRPATIINNGIQAATDYAQQNAQVTTEHQIKRQLRPSDVYQQRYKVGSAAKWYYPTTNESEFQSDKIIEVDNNRLEFGTGIKLVDKIHRPS